MKFMNKLFCLVCMILFPGVALAAQRSISSPAVIPTAGSEFAQAYYEAATGDIYLSIGEDILLIGVTGAPFAFLNGEFDSTLVRRDTALGQTVGSTQVAWQNLNGLPSGIYNIGSLLPIDETIFSVEDFDSTYPEAELVFSVFGISSRTQLNVIPNLPQQIPEPGSGGLLMLVGAFVASRRRR